MMPLRRIMQAVAAMAAGFKRMEDHKVL